LWGKNRCSKGCEARQFRGNKMLLNKRYIMKKGSYIADIANADFITMRQSDNGIMLKLHFNSKEIRYECEYHIAENILQLWTEYKGETVDFGEINLLGDKNEYY